ncbi:geranylgeranyl pyrophosphate synthase-like [Oppia nitens]|uniref:geranylgeranyl pyrophosphate synthase-like n=1 Tax=Oppia nitens TaxID=1686743 RepID=UPI0023DBD37D|nr:geranylgeranyl pyrophosphate synthase-like [Oppia nitens]
MANVNDYINEILLEPYNYLLQSSGKQIRTKLMTAFNYWLKIPDDYLKVVQEIIEMLHNSSLLVDDIEDGSDLRRGKPVAHHVYGMANAINTANYVYFLSLKKIIEKFPKYLVTSAVTMFTDCLIGLHKGQGLDIHWRETFNCPTEQQYFQMINMKTTALFALSVQLMQLFSDNKQDFSQLICLLGTYFQIKDDFANLCSQEYTENKSFCEDITEGKFSFPIIHGIRSQPNDSEIVNILRQKTRNEELKKKVIQKLLQLGSFEYTIGVLNKINSEIRVELNKFEANKQITNIIDLLVSDVQNFHNSQ